ncbi:MAG: TRAP transporter substrate-binding protein [Rhizobiaceae bacterium]
MKIIKLAAALAIATAVQMPTVALSETLKVSTFVPPKHAFNRMLTAWGKELAEKSGGKLTIDLFPAGQLGPPPRQYDLAATGAADVAVHLTATTPGRFPMAELAALPLSYPSAGTDSATSSRRLTELAGEYLAGENPGTKVLWMAVTPPLKINLKGDKPATLADLKGKRIRYAGKVFQAMIEKLGASPMPVSPGEVSESMSKGVIDGATFPYEAVMAFDLGEIVNYSIEPGMASAVFSVVMNEAKFNSLSAEHQKLILDTTGPARAEAFGAMWDHGEAKGRKYVQSKGVEIVVLEGEELAKLTSIVEPMVENTIKEVDAKGMPGRAFFEAYTK